MTEAVKRKKNKEKEERVRRLAKREKKARIRKKRVEDL